MKKSEYNAQLKKAVEYYEKAHIVLTADEKQRIEIADFGLGKINEIGLQLLTYINTERVCAKEMVLLPKQTCPEHRHIPTNGVEGKEETFRCRFGTVYLYVDGCSDNTNIKAELPKTDVSVFNEIVLHEGEQYTIMPNTKHWFQGGEFGAVVSEFSTHSTDETDVFTDKKVIRETIIEE